MSEIKSDALRFLGLAKKAGKLKCGEDSVVNEAVLGTARLILLTNDSSDHVKRRVAANMGPKARKTILPFDREELGMAVGISQTTVAAITDFGFAHAFISKLAAEYPGRYEEHIEPLNQKAQKAVRRRRETAARGGRKKRNVSVKEEETK